jgi:hypothetical protein
MKVEKTNMIRKIYNLNQLTIYGPIKYLQICYNIVARSEISIKVKQWLRAHVFFTVGLL